jgi:hypothetical protein
MSEPIEVKLVRSPGYFGLMCTVCGSFTEQRLICAKSHDPKILVCEDCLASGDVDARLVEHARRLEAGAAFVRNLFGRLRVPTVEQWKAANEGEERLCCVLRLAADMDASNKIGRSREALIEAFERCHPDLLPLTEEEIEAWLADIKRRDEWAAERARAPIDPGRW